MFGGFCKDASGATAVEYGLIVAVMALAIVGALSGAADSIVFMWGSNESELQQALRNAGQ